MNIVEISFNRKSCVPRPQRWRNAVDKFRTEDMENNYQLSLGKLLRRISFRRKPWEGRKREELRVSGEAEATEAKQEAGGLEVKQGSWSN